MSVRSIGSKRMPSDGKDGSCTYRTRRFITKKSLVFFQGDHLMAGKYRYKRPKNYTVDKKFRLRRGALTFVLGDNYGKLRLFTFQLLTNRMLPTLKSKRRLTTLASNRKLTRLKSRLYW